jgi:hypothetical protein
MINASPADFTSAWASSLQWREPVAGATRYQISEPPEAGNDQCRPGNLLQWIEYELAAGKAGMGYPQPRQRDATVAVKEQIQVQGTWSPTLAAALAALGLFQGLQPVQ